MKLYVKFPQVQYIDLSATAHVVWAVVIVTSARIKLSTFFMVSDFLSAVQGRIQDIFKKGVHPSLALLQRQ